MEAEVQIFIENLAKKLEAAEKEIEELKLKQSMIEEEEEDNLSQNIEEHVDEFDTPSKRNTVEFRNSLILFSPFSTNQSKQEPKELLRDFEDNF